MPVMKVRVGDVDTEEGRASCSKRSPLTLVDKIKKPLLIGQGANDPRVKQLEADQIVKAMKEKKIPVTYVLYPDEGHGFARPENRKSFNAVTEAFLAEHLGGRFEPVGDDFKGATITVPAGADAGAGLAEALWPANAQAEEAEAKPAETKPGRNAGSPITDRGIGQHDSRQISACVSASASHNALHESHVLVLLLVYLYPPG